MPETWCMPQSLEEMEKMASHETRLVTTPHAQQPMRAMLVRRPRKATLPLLVLKSEVEVVDIVAGAAAAVKQSRDSEVVLCQRYVEPMLHSGAKWDMRVYVLVTAMGPKPAAYISQAGLVYRCGEAWAKPSTTRESSMRPHLTRSRNNSGVQKMDLMDTLQELQDEQQLDEATTWARIDAIVGKTLLRLSPVVHEACGSRADLIQGATTGPSCFQLLEFELMLDQNRNVWLTDVNAEPDFEAHDPVEYGVKKSVAEGILDVVCAGQQAVPNCPFVEVRSLRTLQ